MSIPEQVLEKAKKITLLISDVDGVLTDGSIYLGDAGELKRFSVNDGMGVALARFSNLRIALLSGRSSKATTIRARELRLEDNVYQGYLNKIVAFKEICERYDVQKDEIAYIGDDYVDLPVMREVGLALSVPNGRPEVQNEADYTVEKTGGTGALSEAIELILKARDEFDSALETMEREVYMVEESA